METIQQIDKDCNDPEWWIITANDLIASYASLCSNRKKAEKEISDLPYPRQAPEETRSFWVELMLLGFAQENLLKALWLAKGHSLYKNGVLIRWSDIRAHDLKGISEHVGFSLKPDEVEPLIMLSRIMVGLGRYPFTTNPESETSKESWCSSSDRIVSELMTRLKNEIHSLLYKS